MATKMRDGWDVQHMRIIFFLPILNNTFIQNGLKNEMIFFQTI